MVNPWLVALPAVRAPRRRVIAVPWAGSGAAALLPWSGQLGDDVELQVVRLPGRESRFTEQRLTRTDEVVDALLPVVHGLPPLPTAVFGYSLGALIAYELARELHTRGDGVRLLAVGGSAAPHRLPPRARIAGLDDAAFAAVVRDLDGTSAAIFEHPELLELLLPVLRADFAMVEGYRPRASAPLSCPVSTFSGHSDPELTEASVDAWAETTTGPTTHHRYDGGHFFLMDNGTELIADLRADLLRHLALGATG